MALAQPAGVFDKLVAQLVGGADADQFVKLAPLLAVLHVGKARLQCLLHDAVEVGVIELLFVAGVVHAQGVAVKGDLELDVMLEEGAVPFTNDVREQYQQRQQADADRQHAIETEAVFRAITARKAFAPMNKIADGVILMGGANEEFTSWQIDLVRQGAEQAGRSMDEIKLHLWAAIAISDDRDQARDDVSHWVASQAETFSKWKHLPEFLHPYKADFASASKAYDRLEHMSQHAGHKGSVSPELVDYLALVGTADECLARIRKLEKLGLDGVTLAFRAGGRRQRMEVLHEGIIKPLKESA